MRDKLVFNENDTHLNAVKFSNLIYLFLSVFVCSGRINRGMGPPVSVI